MQNPFYIFRIKREERWPAAVALAYVVLWNVLVVCKYADKFMPLSNDYRKVIIHNFHISGYDPLTYLVLWQWGADYNIYRHPLLAFFMFLPNQLNQALMMLTGMNWAQVVTAALLVACGFYSFVFLFRIFREVVGTGRADACLLCALTYSFAYVIVGVSVPDHFCLSMFMLILTLYVAGRKMKSSHPFTIWQTVLFFFITAGISLNNGIKVFLANLFVNGKAFFRPRNLLLAVILPSALIWIGARIEWRLLERPQYEARVQKRHAVTEKRHAKIARAFRDTTRLRDTAAISRGIAQAIARADSVRTAKKKRQAVFAHAGKPLNHTEFGQWTDISTPRWQSLVENIFGEPLQLHQDHLLEDVLTKRPVIVHYRYAINYVVEALIVLLFLAGVWFGRRNRFLWLALSFFGFDMLIHFVLGFGLNEVYIMSPHWLFTLTIAMSFLVRRLCTSRLLLPLRTLLFVLTAWLAVWNAVLYGGYLV